MSTADMVLGALVVALGSSLQGLTGFGAALVSVPLLLLIDPGFVPGPVIVSGTVLNILSSIRADSRDILPDVRWTIAGQIPGAALAAAVLASMPPRGLILLFAAIVLAAAGASASGWHPPVNNSVLLAAGACSGFFGTAAGIGGPPVALLWQDQRGPVLRATLARHFLAGAVFSIVFLVLAGRLGPHDVVIALALVPGTFLGFGVSGRVLKLIDPGALRVLVICLSAASAVAVALKELL